MPTSTAADENVELLQRGYAAFAAGDMETITQIFAEEITWHVQRLGTLSGDKPGLGEVLAFFGRTMEMSGGTFHITPISFLANQEYACAIVISQGERNGRTLDDRQAHVFRLEDGRVEEVWQFAGPEADDFWA